MDALYLCTPREEELQRMAGAQEIGRIPVRLQDREGTDSPSQAPWPARRAQSHSD